MATVPLREENDSFGHEEANCPFAIETAIYDSGNDELDVSVGQGRYDFGDGTTFEQTATTITSFSAPAASTTYYVYIDYNAGAPKVTINTTSTATPGQIRIGSVVTDGSKNVSSTSDLRGLLPPAPPFASTSGSLGSPAYSFLDDSNSGMWSPANGIIGWSVNGNDELRLNNSSLYPGADVAIDLGSSTNRFHEGYFRDRIYIWDDDSVQHEISRDPGGLSGLWVRALSNPASGHPLFGVQSSGQADRFRVDHDGDALHVAPSGSICSHFLSGGNAAAPGFAFSNDSNTGIYSGGNGVIAFSSNGNNYITFDSGGNIDMSYNTVVGTGLSNIQFLRSGSTDTVRLDSNDLVDFYTASTLRVRVHDGGLQVNVNGTKADPSIHFNDPDVGFFHDAGLNRLNYTNDLGSSSDWEATMIMSSTQLVTGRHRVGDLGNSTFAWDDVRADTFTNDSDLNIKNTVEDTPLGLDFVRALRPRSFVKNHGNRVHEGFGAQEVVDAMKHVGVEDRAIWADPMVNAPDPEKWPEFYEDDGETPSEGRGVLSLRPIELIGPLAKAIQELAARVDKLDGTPAPKPPKKDPLVRKSPAERRAEYVRKGIAQGGRGTGSNGNTAIGARTTGRDNE